MEEKLIVLQQSHHSEKQLVYPPYCVNVSVIGHLFEHDEEQMIPSWSLKPSQVVRISFPLLLLIFIFNVNSSFYLTIAIIF